MRLNYEEFSPPDGVEPARPNSVIILPNQLAASVDDYSGMTAQAVADKTGIDVLGVDRQGSGGDASVFWGVALNRFFGSNYLEIVDATAHEVRLVLDDRFPDCDVIMAGHSGGMTEAAMLAASDKLIDRVVHVVGTDPEGLLQVGAWRGAGKYVWYTLNEFFKYPKDTTMSPNKPPDDKPNDLVNQWRKLGELCLNSGICRESPPVLDALNRIIEHNETVKKHDETIAVDLVFPHAPLIGKKEVYKIAWELNDKVDVHTIGRSHVSFDNNNFLAKVLDYLIRGEVFARAIALGNRGKQTG